MWLYFRYSKKFKIVIITLSIMVLICFVFIIKNAVLNKNKNNNSEKNKYVNKEEYFEKNRPMNFRNVEYIGGEKIYINRPIGISDKESTYVGDRWYPFFRDVDTGEILRGLEYYNYITVGMPYVGLDKMDVPKERKTIKGFQKYVLDWTGSVLCQHKGYIKNPSIRRNIKGDFYGNGIYDVFRFGYFDRPIDIVADYLWGNQKDETSGGYDIYNIEDVKNFNYSLQIVELSPIEWVMNILRNCFGFISDDFYDLYNKNIINFERIDIKDVKVGDIGAYGDEETGYHIGICIGYDKKSNPIFSTCTTNKNLKDMEKYTAEVKKSFEINGFNILHIENLEKKDNNLFRAYYKTNLPFVDEKFNLRELKIDDISKYNLQFNDKMMYERLMNERVRRIMEREKKAAIIRKDKGINLEVYKNVDISTIYLITETYTYEYQHLFKNVGEEKKKEFHRTTYAEWKQEQREKFKDYGKDFTSEQINNVYNEYKEEIKNKILNEKDKLKSTSEQDIEKWFYDNGGNSFLDLMLLKKYIKDHPDILD